MAKQIATEQVVFEAATAIQASGHVPTIVTVQEHIGAGSYTTIKRHLDAWIKSQATAEAVELPESVAAKSAELGRALWSVAVRESEKRAQEAKDAAAVRVAAMAQELEAAQAEIARLESVEALQAAKAEELSSQLAQTLLALKAAELLAARVPDLEQRLHAEQSALAAARQESTSKAVEVGRLTGETDALRRQLSEVTAALVATKAAPSAGT